jgi:hypothetical protein
LLDQKRRLTPTLHFRVRESTARRREAKKAGDCYAETGAEEYTPGKNGNLTHCDLTR